MTHPQSGIPTPDAKPAKRRIKLWHVALVLLVIALGWFAWSHNRNVPTTVVTPVPMTVTPAASAASVPEAAASAPAPAASEPTLAPAAPAVEAPKTYTVKEGDWLSLVFPNDWKAVCELNREVLKKGCGHIEAGQVLTLPEGVEPTEKSARAPKPKVAKVKKPEAATAPNAALPKTNDAGEILYRTVGRAPLNGCGKRDIATVSKEAWDVLGLSNDDQAWLQLNADLVAGPRLSASANAGIMKLDTGIRLEQVTFCRNGKVVAMGPMRTAWDADTAVYGERFVLPSGKVLVWMRNCFNWVILPEEKKEPPAPPPPPAEPPVAPPAPPEPPAEPPAPIPPAAEAPKGLCERIDMTAAIGQHHVPTQNGDKASSNFLAFLMDCLQRLENDEGSWGLGGKVNYSDWKGTANRGAGQYTGKNYSAMVSYRQIMDKGYDWGFAAGPGRQKESYRQGAYASKTSYDLIGVTASYNDYVNRLAGKTWDVERQYYAGISVPITTEVSQTWNGANIPDTSNMPRLKVGVQAGARWWFYESESLPVLPFVEGGLFVQHPTTASASAMIGIADPYRICGIGIGVDKDLQNSGDLVGAWGWFCDPVQGGRVVRSKYRRHQIVTEAERRGTLIEEAPNGGLIIRSSAEQ